MKIVVEILAMIALGLWLSRLTRKGGAFLAATATIVLSLAMVWGLQWSLLRDPNPSWPTRFCFAYCLVHLWLDLFKRFPPVP